MKLFSIFKKKTPKKDKNWFEIYDSSGFIGLVNNELYNTFVDENWELDELLNRFKEETNRKNCVIWNTGTQNLMSIKIVNEFSAKKVFREVKAQLKITNNCCYLVNYDDLSMCAQFSDEKIPSNLNSDLKIELENGIYDIKLRQLFNPENYDFENYPEPCFELILKKTELETKMNFENVIWWKN